MRKQRYEVLTPSTLQLDDDATEVKGQGAAEEVPVLPFIKGYHFGKGVIKEKIRERDSRVNTGSLLDTGPELGPGPA